MIQSVCERDLPMLTEERGEVSVIHWQCLNRERGGSITVEVIRDILNQVPFEPFVIELCDGDIEVIEAPNQVLLLKSKLLLGDAHSDRFRSISMFDILSIQPQRILHSAKIA